MVSSGPSLRESHGTLVLNTWADEEEEPVSRGDSKQNDLLQMLPLFSPEHLHLFLTGPVVLNPGCKTESTM